MHLHEFQAKKLFSEYGIAVPEGHLVRTLEELDTLPPGPRVAKAQVHAGGRGKAGGVRPVEDAAALRTAVQAMLGTRLVTAQTAAAGLPVAAVLVEQPVAIVAEYYLALLLDRQRERLIIMASAAGGMDIETVAAETPEAIYTECIEPASGLQPYQCRKLGYALGLEGTQLLNFTAIVTGMVRLATERDASLVEINPLVCTDAGDLVALDAKLDIDDNALYRQPALAELRDLQQEEDKERQAREHGLNYVTLDGSIACMVNGAGLAMATMDLIKLHGGEPANFLDVGGTATAERVAEAFKLIVSDARIKAILVNIFGGIVRCDLIAEGVLQAVREVGVSLPVVVRLEGTRAQQGRELLAAAGMNLQAAADLTDATKQVVLAASH